MINLDMSKQSSQDDNQRREKRMNRFPLLRHSKEEKFKTKFES